MTSRILNFLINRSFALSLYNDGISFVHFRIGFAFYQFKRKIKKKQKKKVRREKGLTQPKQIDYLGVSCPICFLRDHTSLVILK